MIPLLDGKYVRLVPVSNIANPAAIEYSEGLPFSYVDFLPIL